MAPITSKLESGQLSQKADLALPSQNPLLQHTLLPKFGWQRL